MVELELWKDELKKSITDIYDEAKKIREYLEQQDEQDHQENQDVQDDQDDQEVQDDQEDQDDQEKQDDQEDQDDQEGQEFQEVIIEKLDDINDSINILNKTVVEGSLVVSISIIIALAFHYFINQISKW